MMLRIKILASTIPLLVAAVFARSELTATQPCIAMGETSVQIATAPWQAQLHVGFTDDPARATVRVQIVDTAEAADFAVVDDIEDDHAGDGACGVTASTQFIAITASPSATEPVIYLSHDDKADYRIFVKSNSFTARDAAAMIVGASRDRARVTAALY
jgi:hypothetical protein